MGGGSEFAMTEKLPHFVIGKRAKLLRKRAKAMRGRIALQSTSCKNYGKLVCFHGSFGSACASRVALMRISIRSMLSRLALRYQYETRFNNELLLCYRAI